MEKYDRVFNEKNFDFPELKYRTIANSNIEYLNGSWRYVNHIDKLVTTGFKTKQGLLKNSDIIRFDPSTIDIMQSRYKSLILNN